MTQFLNRILSAIQLEPAAYVEIKENKAPLMQALILVFLSSIATGIGSVGGYVEKIPLAILTAFVAWTIWVLIIYIFGALIFAKPQIKTDLQTVTRVIGFASTPGILKLLAFLPAISGITLFGATVWMLATTAVATQQALSYESFPRALGITFAGWLIYQALLFQI